jgi:hypothetical protein
VIHRLPVTLSNEIDLIQIRYIFCGMGLKSVTCLLFDTYKSTSKGTIHWRNTGARLDSPAEKEEALRLAEEAQGLYAALEK